MTKIINMGAPRGGGRGGNPPLSLTVPPLSKKKTSIPPFFIFCPPLKIDSLPFKICSPLADFPLFWGNYVKKFALRALFG